MKYFKIGLIFFCSFLLSIPVFAQPNLPTIEIAKLKSDRIKADILQDIETLDRKDQAVYYASLGENLFETNQKEGLVWLTKGVDIIVNPSTAFKSDAEKLSYLWNVLHHVMENDDALYDKLIVYIKQIKVDESDPEISEKANRTYVNIADQILSRKKDDKLAFEFAMLSLKGKNPAAEWSAAEFFWEFKNANEELANTYFAKLIEIQKTTGNQRLASSLANYFALKTSSNFPTNNPRFNLSDPQKKALIELLLPAIQKDAEALAGKKRADCNSITYWGVIFFDDYKRLLPEKFPMVEQAISICQNANIESWKKPDFQKRPRRTSQDWLNLAKEITDKRIQANYLKFAESAARRERNFMLSETILESIDQNFRDDGWKWGKIETISNQFDELFKRNDFAGANKILENAPPEYRPFAALHWLQLVTGRNAPQKDFILNLLTRTRAEFNKMNPVPANPRDWSTHPTKFADLIRYYVKFGFYDEAIQTHEESVKSLNLYIAGLPAQSKENGIIPRFSSYSRFTNQAPPNDLAFIDLNFDRIYDSLNKITDAKLRVFEKTSFFRHISKTSPVYMNKPLLTK